MRRLLLCSRLGLGQSFTFVFNTNSEGAVSIKFNKFNSFILSQNYYSLVAGIFLITVAC